VDFPGLSLDLSALGEENRPDPAVRYDLLILGGGPAAMSAAIYAARKMLKVAMLAKDFGGQVAYTSEIENYLGFMTISGKDLVDRFVEQVKEFKVPVAKGEQVVKVGKTDGVFQVSAEGGATFTGRTVLLATGKRDRPLNVPGEKELVGRGVAYCSTCDAPFYRGQKVAVAGGANSAFTAALDLLKVDAQVTLINFVEGWQADPIMIESARKYGDRVAYLDEHEIVRIEGTGRVAAVVVRSRKTGEESRLDVSGIFIEIGLLPNSEPVEGLVEMNRNREVVVDCHCRTSLEGLFAAGDVTTVPHKQIVISAGEGAKAALSAYDYLTRRGMI
jgi:alkyl hydroperoxide reductase subunit F